MLLLLGLWEMNQIKKNELEKILNKIGPITNCFNGKIPNREQLILVWQLMAWLMESQWGDKIGEPDYSHPSFISQSTLLRQSEEVLGRLRDSNNEENNKFLAEKLREQFLKRAYSDDTSRREAFSNYSPSLKNLNDEEITNVILKIFEFVLSYQCVRSSKKYRYVPIEILAAWLSEHNRRQNNDTVSDELASLMALLVSDQHVSGQNGESIYIPYEFNFSLTVHVLKKLDVESLYVDHRGQSPVPWLISILLGGKIEATQEDTIIHPFMNGGELRKFKRVISVLPQDAQYEEILGEQDEFNRFDFLPDKKRFQSVEVIISHLLTVSEKKLVICLPGRFLTARAHQLFRKKLLDLNLIEAVIQLPERQNVRSSILVVINKERGSSDQAVCFVDAQLNQNGVVNRNRREMVQSVMIKLNNFFDPAGGSYKQSSDEIRFKEVGVRRINPEDSLLPSQYINADDHEYGSNDIADQTYIELRTIVDCVRPFLRITREFQLDQSVDSDDGIEVFEIGPADFPEDGYFDAQVLQRLREDSSTNKRKSKVKKGFKGFLSPGDLIMTTKGRSNIGSVALFTGQETDQDGFWTAAQSCLILRLTNFASKDWKPEILLSILRSAFIQRQLKEASMVSSSVPLLRIERICSLLVPDLTDDQKGKIQPLFERVSENRNELQKMQQKLEAKQKELQDLQADIDKVIFDS